VDRNTKSIINIICFLALAALVLTTYYTIVDYSINTIGVIEEELKKTRSLYEKK